MTDNPATIFFRGRLYQRSLAPTRGSCRTCAMYDPRGCLLDLAQVPPRCEINYTSFVWQLCAKSVPEDQPI